MDRLKGKSLIVTGGANGIGRAIAQLAASEGARVMITDIDVAGGNIVRDHILAAGGKAAFMQHDITDSARTTQIIEATVVEFGGLDVLVNNAGIQLTCPLLQITLEQWRRVFSVNVEAAFVGTQCALKQMIKTGTGSIINISSTLSSVPLELNAAYCASKAAVTQLTKVTALEMASVSRGIRVNSVHPGVIATPMVEREMADVARLRESTPQETIDAEFDDICPLGIGAPEDIAYGVIYLASDEAKYVTGTELVIDGGHLLK